MKSVVAFTFLILSLFTFSAQAEQMSLFGGINSTEFDGGNWDREFGLEFGVSYVKALESNKLFFRTGAGLVQKNSEVDNRFNSREVELLYLEIPATIMFEVNDKFKLFGGLNLDINLADDDADAEAFALNLPLGGRFSFDGPHSLEAILEFGVTDIIEENGEDVSIGSSLSVRYLFDFSIN